MICFQCNKEIADGDGIKYNHRYICEDCYLDNTVVTRTCDPESVRMTKNMESLGISSGKISPAQEKIVEIVGRTGGITPERLSKELGVPADELQRDLAALRQMRRIQGEKRGEERYIVKYRS
ncbi:MAG: hypothetical protein MUC95_06415 [Spirochaetes bacterium]|nr:hypothetical protein [Spirochaetota bacterium]